MSQKYLDFFVFSFAFAYPKEKDTCSGITVCILQEFCKVLPKLLVTSNASVMYNGSPTSSIKQERISHLHLPTCRESDTKASLIL